MPTKPGVYATFKTSQGTIVTELFEKDAPEIQLEQSEPKKNKGEK